MGIENTIFSKPRQACAWVVAALGAALLPVAASAQTKPPLVDFNIEELMGVTIQRVFGASERLQPVTEAPSSITIITANDIARYGYRTVADILRGVRGFYISNDRNYSYVGVRGFGIPGDYNSRVLLLINGHKVNDNIYDQAYIGAELGLDVAMFERVEIIRGPASSLYGTSAFFAVVNIVTRSGASIGGARLEVDAGTLRTGLIRGSFGRAFTPGVDIAISGTHERSSGIERLYFPAFNSVDTNGGIAENLDAEQVLSLYGRFKWYDLTVTGSFGRRQKDVPTASYGTIFNSQTPAEETTDRRTMLHAQYDRALGRTRLTADLSFDRLHYGGIYPLGSDDPEAPLVNFDAALGERWTAGLRATRSLPGRQTVTAGAEFIANITQRQWSSYSDAPLESSARPEKSSEQSAVYLQDEIRLRPWLLVNAGLRHDRYERFSQTTPRGAVIVMPSASQSFKYLYGRAFRAPNVYELYYFRDVSSELRPESIGTHELVWEQYFGEWLRTSASAYRYSASRLITLQDDGLDSAGFATVAFFNGGLATAVGLELEGEVRSKSGRELLASYARQRAEDGDDTTMTNSPGRMAKLRFSTPGPLDGSIAAFEMQYLGSRRTYAGTTVPGATIAQATFSARITPAVDLVASVRNLFNTIYSDPASDEHAFDSIRQNGRTARIGVRWKLWTPR